MTEKEFRKLRPLDLIQLLLAQGNEVSQMQAELDRKNEKLALLREGNDILKAKLNDRDALVELLKVRLDKSDADIRELERKAEELYSDKWIDLDKMGSLTEAARELYKIFEVAQHEAEQCIQEAEQRNGELPQGLEHTAAIETVYIDAPQSTSINIKETVSESEIESSEEVTIETKQEPLEELTSESELLEEQAAETESEPEQSEESESELESSEETESEQSEESESELKEEVLVTGTGEESKEEASVPETEPGCSEGDEPKAGLEVESSEEAVTESVPESLEKTVPGADSKASEGPVSESENKVHYETHKNSHREAGKESPHQNRRKKFLGRFLFGRHR